MKEDKTQVLGGIFKSILGTDDSTLKDTGISLLKLLQAGGSAVVHGTRRTLQERLDELRRDKKEDDPRERTDQP